MNSNCTVRGLGILAGLGLALGLVAQAASAATFTWNGGTSGGWDVSSANWSGATGPTLWDSGTGGTNAADFKTTGATASVSSGIYTYGIIFDNTVLITGGGTINLAGTTPFVAVNATGGTIDTFLAGTSGLMKSGSGILTLTAANLYTGTTTMSAGTLALGAGGSLATAGSLNFSGNSTFNVGANSQSLANLNVATDGVTGIVNGSGGTLTLTGGAFSLAPSSNSTSRNLNLSGLSNFVYSNTAGTFRVDGASVNSIGSASATLTLSPTSSITAANFYVGQFALNGGGSGNDAGTVNLGQNTTINANSIYLGHYHDAGTLQYGSAMSNPVLTICGTGGLATRANATIGGQTYGSNGYGLVNLASNATNGTLNAMFGTLGIGVSDRGGNTGTALTNNGSFIMAAGTLDATTIMLGQLGLGSSASANGSTTTGTFASGAGAIVKVQNLYLGDSQVFGGNAQSVNVTYTLDGGGTLSAQTVANGPDTGTIGTFTRTFNWNSGTIANYNDTAGTTGLMVSIPTLTMAATGTHTFSIDAGYSGSVSSAIGQTGGNASLIKAGAGFLTLSGSNNYAGGTTVTAGTLLFSGSTSLPSSGTLSVNSGATVSTADGATRALTVGGLNLSGGAALVMDLGDQFSTAGAAATAGNLTITLSPSGTFTSGTAYNALQATGGGLANATYSLLANNPNYTATLSVASTGVAITPTSATPLTSAFWYGGLVPGASGAMALSNGTLSNWSSGQSYSATGLVPGAAANVIFSTSAGATQQSGVVLGANLTVNSLTFNDTTPVTIGNDGNTLTLMGTGTGTSSAISANQNATINANLALGTSQTWTVASGQTLTVGGPVSGVFALATAGSGTVLLLGNNSYSGSTSISAGTLAIDGGGVLGGGNYAAAIANAGALVVSTSSNQTLGGIISGSGALYQLGSGTTTLTGINTYTGGTTINAGTLKYDLTSRSTDQTSPGPVVLGNIAVNSGGTLQLYTNVGLNYTTQTALLNTGTAFSGSGTITKTGAAGIVDIWTGSEMTNFSGLIDVQAGILAEQSGSITSGSASLEVDSGAYFDLRTSNVSVNDLTGSGGTIASSYENQTLTVGAKGGSSTFGGVIQNAIPTALGGSANGQVISLTKGGSGELTLLGANSYTGGTSITGGTLQLGGAGVLGNGNYSATIANSGALVLYSSANQLLSGAISGTGDLYQLGSGKTTLTASSNYTGGTTVGGGTLNINNDYNLGDSSGSLTFSGNSTLQQAATASVNLASGRSIGINSGVTATIDTQGNAMSIGGPISGSGGLTKVGAGALTLAGNNTYTGDTNVNAGQLVVSGSLASGGNVNLAGGTTLSGTGSVGQTIVSGGGIDLTASGTNALTLSGLAFSGSGTLSIANITNYGAGPAIIVTGSNGLSPNDVTVALSGASPVGSGTAQLIEYSGSMQGSGSSGFSLSTAGISGLGARALLALTFSNAGFVDLNYSNDHPVWSGAGDGTWTTALSTTAAGTTNWVLASSPSASTNFIAGDSPVFDDTAGTGTTTVNISAGNVAPSLVTFNNNSLSYTLTGAFGITDAAGPTALVKNGTGSLTLGTSNSYSGGTTFNAGLLNVNNASALGSGSLAINGGTLGNTSGAAVALSTNNPQTWNNSSLIFIGPNDLNLGTGAVTITNSAQAITLTGGNLTVGGAIGGAASLTLAGAGQLTLGGSNTYTGPTTITGGTLTVNGSLAASSSVSVGMAATLAGSGTVNGNATLTGNGAINFATGGQIAGTLGVTGGNWNGQGSVGGVVTASGAGNVFTIGSGASLNAAAGVNVSGGTLALATGASLAATNSLNFTGNGVFNVGANSQTLANMTVADSFSGTVAGSGGTLTLTSGLSVSPVTSSTTTALNLSNLSTFIFNAPSGTLAVRPSSTSRSSNPSMTAVLTLAPTNTITAEDVNVTGEDHQNVVPPSATAYLGTTTTINASYIEVGAGVLGTGDGGGGTLQFAAGLTSPTLTIRGSNGSYSNGDRATINVGNVDTGGQSNTRTSTFNVSAGNLDALVGTLYVAYNTRNSATTPNIANFVMGSGTLDATAINIADDVSGSGTAEPINGAFTLGNGGIVRVGALTLGNQFFNTLTGTFNLNGGTLSAQLVQSGAGTAARNFNWNSGTIANYNSPAGGTAGLSVTIPTLTMAASGTHTFSIDAGQSGAVSSSLVETGGSASLIKAGPGLLMLSGSDTYSGGTGVIAGTLQLGNSAALGTGGLAVNGGTLDLAGYGITLPSFSGAAGTIIDSSGTASLSTTLFTVSQSASTTFGGSFQTGPNGRMVSLLQEGPGGLTLNGANVLGGATVQNSATLQIAGSLTAGTVNVNAAAQITGSGALTLTNSASGLSYNSSAASIFSGTIGGVGGLAVTSGALALGGSASYSGATTISSGTLAMGTMNALPYGANAGNVTVNGLLNLSGQTANINGLSGSGTVDNTAVAPATLVVGNNNATSTFSGVVQNSGGALGLTKVGSGTFTLASTNSYLGATTVQAGVLALGAYGAPNSAVAVTGGTLDASGFAQNIYSFSMGSLGSLNLGVNNLLASTGLDNFGGTLNVSGDTGAAILATYGSLGAGRFADFTGLQSGYTLSYGATDLAIVSSGPPAWQFATSGSWADGTKWTSNVAPSGSGQTAIVGAATTTSYSITLDGPQTLGTLIFTNTASNTAGYSLDAGTAGTGSLTLDNTGSTAQIIVNGGSHAITAPLYVSNGTLEVTAGSSGVLTISGSVSDFGTGASLTLDGDGTGELVLSGTNTLGGASATATVASGTLVLNSNEALADGTSLIVGDASLFGGIQLAGGAEATLGKSRLQVAPVPEPGTFALFTAAAVLIVVSRRRRRR